MRLALLLGESLEGRADPERARVQIDVLPVETEDLALPKSEGDADGEVCFEPVAFHLMHREPRLELLCGEFLKLHLPKTRN